MKFHLETFNACGGPILRVSGISRPDKYLFQRVNGNASTHRLTVSGEKISEVFDDLGMRPAVMDIRIKMRVEIEPGDRDATEMSLALADALHEAEVKLAAAEKTIDDLRGTVAPPASTPGVITEEELAFLAERDAILEVLLPLARDDEDPLAVVRRIADLAHGATNARTPEDDVSQGPPNRATLEKMKKAELVHLAAERGLPSASEENTKAQLIDAILA